MRKLICTLLILCIIISSFGATTVAYGDNNDDDFEYFSHSVKTELDSSGSKSYYAFNNPTKIASSSKYIAVIEENIYGKKQLSSFNLDGEFLHSTLLGDPRDVEIIDNYAYVLDYDLKNEYANIYQVDLLSGVATIVIPEIISRDISTDGDYLYVLKAGLVQGISKYNVSSSDFNPDNSFDKSGMFLNSTAISVTKDYILGFQTYLGQPSIVSHDIKNDKTIQITDLPDGGVKEFFFDGKNLFVLNTNGVYIGNLSDTPNFTLALSLTDSTISLNENILDPISFCFDKTEDKGIYVLDNKNSLSVKKFLVSSNLLVSAMFSINSFSGETGSFNTPTDVTYSNGNTYYADSKNHRIVIRSDRGKMSYFDTIDKEGNAITPYQVGIDYSSNIYIASENVIYKYSSSYELLDTYTSTVDKDFSVITALYVSNVSDEVYAINGSKIIVLNPKDNKFYVAKPTGASSDVFTVDMRNNRAIYCTGSLVNVYDLNEEKRITSFNVGSNSTFEIKDVTTDFQGSIYMLVESSTFSYIYKYSIDKKDAEEYIGAGQLRLEDSPGFKAFALDYDDDEIYLLPQDEHRIYTIGYSGFSRLETEYSPSIDIPKDIFNQKYDEDATLGTIVEKGNRLIYPLDDNDGLYPDNYSVMRTRKLNADDVVVVAGYTDDKEFAYVISNNAAGFMDADAIVITNQNTNVPFEQGVSLHDNMYVYKYPLLTVYDHEPLYSIDQISKNHELEILDNASDYVSPTGLYWYKVSYEKDGETCLGYVPRYNVVENLNQTNPNLEYGKINADLLHGFVEVYADLGDTKIGKTLQDKSKVIIHEIVENYAYVEEVTDSGTGIIGYVFLENITTAAQTKSQTTALILIVVLIAVVVLLFIVKAIIKKVNR